MSTGTVIIVLLLILLTLAFMYIIVIVSYISGWDLVKPFEENDPENPPFISVIVPFRNEKENLPQLIRSLSLQKYPPDRTEFIFIDDHSTDNSGEIISNKAKNDVRFRLLTNQGKGKKAALLTGTGQSRGQIILQTDADTLPSQNWIGTMIAFLQHEDAAFVAGTVVMHTGKSFFHRLQALEHLSLTAAGIGAYGSGKPVLCSGANLMYKKSLIEKYTDPYRKTVRGGDDVFFLHEIKKTAPETIRFIKSSSAYVEISASGDPLKFIRQRSRWAGKSVFFNDRQSLVQGSIIFLFNTAIAGTTGLGFISPFWLAVAVIFYIIKSVPDYILLRKATGFFKRKELRSFFIPAQIIYPWYVLVSVVSGFVIILFNGNEPERKNQWK